MDSSDHEANKNKKYADFVGEPDPVTNIFILWVIKEVKPKALLLKYLPEIPEALKNVVHISDRMDVVMNYFCGHAEGRFVVGFYTSNPQNPEEMRLDVIDNSFRHNNPFIMYRAIRALKCFARIDYPDDMIRIAHAFDPSDKQYDEDKMWLIRIINKDRYDEIAKDIPPELEEAVDALLVKGSFVDKAPFEAEIKRGLINSTSLMRTLKIPTQEEEKKREARFERMVEPYWECAVKYLGYKKYPAIESDIAAKLKKYVYEAIARGIDDQIDAVAIAMIMYYREMFIEKNKPSGVSDARSIEPERIKNMEAESGIIRQIAGEFAECFMLKNITPEELFRRYDNYLKNFNVIEPVDLLAEDK